jgi:multiple sugar transport system ATP-binding protein
MAAISLENIRKSYGSHEVIKGVDLDVEDGAFVVFVGPSGCGKSTMLRMIAGLETITDGRLLIDGAEMNEAPPVRRGVAMVFQSYALYPNMTVFQNLAFGLEQARMPKDEIRMRVTNAARMLQIEPLLERRPSQLSGGQSQRVAIGRAIVRDPKIFLFDEPLSNLDAELRVHMRVEIANLHQRLRRTTLYVTHDQVEAMTLADTIVVFNQGRIEQVGAPLELYNRPVNRFVAGFLGSPKMNFLPARIVGEGSSSSRVRIAGGEFPIALSSLAGREAITIGIRPESIDVVSPERAAAVARVHFAEYLGGETFLHCEMGEAAQSERIVVKRPGQQRFAARELIGLSLGAEALYCFDADTGEALQAAPAPG